MLWVGGGMVATKPMFTSVNACSAATAEFIASIPIHELDPRP